MKKRYIAILGVVIFSSCVTATKDMEKSVQEGVSYTESEKLENDKNNKKDQKISELEKAKKALEIKQNKEMNELNKKILAEKYDNDEVKIARELIKIDDEKKAMIEGKAPEIIYKDNPIYVTRTLFYPLPETQKQNVKQDSSSVVTNSMNTIIYPEEYNGGTIIYDYIDNSVYEIYAKPISITDIVLQVGEVIIDDAACGDSQRWIITGGISTENGSDVQHVYIKPIKAGLDTTLFINTSKRVYRIRLRSYENLFMAAVKWNYPLSSSVINGKRENGYNPSVRTNEIKDESYINISTMSFDYTVSYQDSKSPVWLPIMVWDDGKKTYIHYPDETIYQEIPGIFNEKDEMVNYRVVGNVVTIDRLIKKVTLKLKNEKVIIEKKVSK